MRRIGNATAIRKLSEAYHALKWFVPGKSSMAELDFALRRIRRVMGELKARETERRAEDESRLRALNGMRPKGTPALTKLPKAGVKP